MKLLASVAAAALLVASSANAATALRAADFVQSVGANLNVSDPAINGHVSTFLTRVNELGIHQFRSGAPNAATTAICNAGNKILFGTGLMKINLTPQFGIDRVNTVINNATWKACAMGFEGVNQYNNSGNKATYGQAGTITKIRDHQTAVWNRVQQVEPPQFDVVGPSIQNIGANLETDSKALGNEDAITDIANSHMYTAHTTPESIAPGNWEKVYKYNYTHSATPTLYVTEFGFCNYLPEARCLPVNPAATLAMRYLMTLQTRNQHSSRDKAFVYASVDPDSSAGEGAFGIMQRDANLTPKPIFYAIRNTLRILADTNRTFAPGSLAYTITGRTATTKDVLFQKGDGKFYVVVWNAPSIDYKSDPQPARVSMSLNLPSAKNVRVFEPSNPTNITTRDQPVATFSGVTSVPLSVPDHIVIVELS